MVQLRNDIRNHNPAENSQVLIHANTVRQIDLCPQCDSTAILSLPLIQEEQLSVTGESMCTKYW